MRQKKLNDCTMLFASSTILERKRFLMKHKTTILTIVSALLLGTVFVACDDSSSDEATSGASALQGTWIRIDSTPEVSMGTNDTSYLHHDTVLLAFSQDGKYADIEKLTSIEVASSHVERSVDTTTGTWSASGSQVTIVETWSTYGVEDLNTVTRNFTVAGSVLRFAKIKDPSASVEFRRYSDKAVIPSRP